jgi:4-amino-4-deoxy-L-arabinose transferase-like glycosyltransferase
VIAAALMATSPIALLQNPQPMSDIPVTAWFAVAACLALDASPRRAAPVPPPESTSQPRYAPAQR